ncbi:MAG TPA: hypothetical protein VM553_04940, partial [Dongiaceae bacterium]|nr:hypothetical protein [Dongiaceae bacterium]
MSNKKPDVISSDKTDPGQLSAWERWQLPSMGQDQPARANAINMRQKSRGGPEHPDLPAPEPAIKPLTAEEVEAIRRAAFEEGLQEGREAGHAEGYKAGFKSGES